MPKEGTYFITEKGRDLRNQLGRQLSIARSDLGRSGSSTISIKRDSLDYKEEIERSYNLLDDLDSMGGYYDGGKSDRYGMDQWHKDQRNSLDYFKRGGYIEFKPGDRELN